MTLEIKTFNLKIGKMEKLRFKTLKMSNLIFLVVCVTAGNQQLNLSFLNTYSFVF